MAGPWEKYQKQQPAAQTPGGPWLKYSSAAAAPPTQAVPQETLDNLNAQNIANNANPNMVSGDKPGLLSKATDAFSDLGKGALKGALNTATSLSPLINKIPGVGEKLAPSSGIAAANILKQPTNPSQKVGFGAEQVGEWMLPTGLEEKAAQAVAAHAPQAARWAIPAAKLATAATETGVRNTLQGGDFSTGAQAGLYGGLASPILQKGARSMAEIAMAPGKRLLKSIPEGVDIGKTVLENSAAVKPSKIASQLGDKISGASGDLDNLLTAAKNNGVTVPLAPARQAVQSELTSAAAKNAPSYTRDVNKLGDQLQTDYGVTGKSSNFLPPAVDPVRARALKQGIDLGVGSWDPSSQAAIAPLQERVRGAISGGIHGAVPGSAALDSKMTSLIPAKDAAWNVSFNPSITRNIFNRIARPTGALAGGLYGAHEGYQRGGAEGALAGGALGMAIPELISSPTGQMAIARSLYSPATINAAKGAGLQFNRQNLYGAKKPY